MKPLSKMAKFRMRDPALAVHDVVRAGGHRMRCANCGVLGNWSGRYGVYTRPNTTRVCGYVLCVACVDVDPAIYMPKVEALLATEERWERAS